MQRYAFLWRSPHARTIAGYSLVANLLLLAPSLFMLQVYDRVLHSRSVPTLVYLAIITLVALGIWGLAESVRARVATRAAANYTITVAPKLFAKLSWQGLPPGVRGRALRDLTSARAFIGGRGFLTLFDLPFIPLYTLLIFCLHWSLGLLTIAGVALLCLLGWLNVSATSEELARARDADADAIGFAQAILRREEDMRAAGLQSRFLSIWGRKVADALRRTDDAGGRAASYQSLSKTVRQGLQVLMMALGALLVIEDQLSAGMIFMCSMVSGKALAPVDQAIAGWEQISRGFAAIRGVEDMTGPDKRISERMHMPPPRAVLNARGITWCPDPARPDRRILDGIDLDVQPGECVLVTGAIGTGKSTLLRILSGAIEPSMGTMAIDGIDRTSWPSAQLGQLVGYVAQDVDFFPGTIADNIAGFDPDMADAAVIEAARRADVHDAILALPNGYRTMLGGGGNLLSVGQRQKISIARALYGDPLFLILDEPNASLDGAGERALIAAIASAKARGAAVVLAAHRTSVLHVVDRVYALADGKLHGLTRVVGAKPPAASPVSPVASVEPVLPASLRVQS